MENIYLPQRAVIEKIVVENNLTSTFTVNFCQEAVRNSFHYQPGQFVMVSLPHCGEAPISISSTPTRPGPLQLTVRRAGKLTTALHGRRVGEVIGLRGPYGRPFPIAEFAADLLIVAGGIGLAPLRAVIDYCLDRRPGGKITILHGSRHPEEIIYRRDQEFWRQQPGVTAIQTVDAPVPGWSGPVGVVTTLMDQLPLAPPQTTAVVCGPPIMFRFVLQKLQELKIPDEQIYTTLERQMKCGVGLCGHCHLEGKLICTEGPVFRGTELKSLRRPTF